MKAQNYFHLQFGINLENGVLFHNNERVKEEVTVNEAKLFQTALDVVENKVTYKANSDGVTFAYVGSGMQKAIKLGKKQSQKEIFQLGLERR